MDITGENTALILHQDSRCKGLSSRGRTGIQNTHSRLRRSHFHCGIRRAILHIGLPRFESFMPVDGRFGVVRRKKRFRKGQAMPICHTIDKPFRMAVTDREIIRQMHVTVGKLSENGIDKPASTGKPACAA